MDALSYETIRGRKRPLVNRRIGRAPPVESAATDCFGQPAQTRRPGGTQKGLLTVASFRTWRGSKSSAAPDPIVVATYPGRAAAAQPSRGNSTPLSGLRARLGREGTTSSPSSTTGPHGTRGQVSCQTRRRGRDLNPRCLSAHALSRRAL